MEAKKGNQRSRAYYKLAEIDQKYKLFKRGDHVLDLGCWPGGWIQYSVEKVGKSGGVLGFDLKETDSFDEENVSLHYLDLFEDIDEALDICKNFFKTGCNSVISDLSPKLTGIKTTDRIQSVGLVERAYYFASQFLVPGGSFVAKLFKSNEAEEFVRGIRKDFEKIYRKELKSTRKTSSEFYVVATGKLKKVEEEEGL
ncbi:UNVERIFIED_CONTAM: hypothetical protein GTU68_034595 [Idotea baltica]|nr:hypothetical protein [Idotea baltica]